MTEQTLAKTPARDPWAELEQLFSGLQSRLYDAVAPSGPWTPLANGAALWKAPRTDVSDTGIAYRITAEVPGIPKDQLEIRVKGTSVEIRGEKAKESERSTEELVHRERIFQGFYRAFELPEPVVAADAKAKVENGVLELELPKQTPTPSPAEVVVKVQ